MAKHEVVTASTLVGEFRLKLRNMLAIASLHLLEVIQILQWPTEQILRVVLNVVAKGLVQVHDLELLAFVRQVIRVALWVLKQFQLALEIVAAIVFF